MSMVSPSLGLYACVFLTCKTVCMARLCVCLPQVFVAAFCVVLGRSLRGFIVFPRRASRKYDICHVRYCCTRLAFVVALPLLLALSVCISKHNQLLFFAVGVCVRAHCFWCLFRSRCQLVDVHGDNHASFSPFSRVCFPCVSLSSFRFCVISSRLPPFLCLFV